jgi:hypothetical protein
MLEKISAWWMAQEAPASLHDRAQLISGLPEISGYRGRKSGEPDLRARPGAAGE